MSDIDTDLVSILVPKRHLGRIYGFISTLDGDVVSAEPGAVTVAEPEEVPTWSPELIRRQFNESPEIMKRFQKLLADHPGEWFSTTEVATRLNAAKGSKSIAGALGAYGRRTSNRYKMKTWPFGTEWNHVEGQMYYSMDFGTAEIVKAL
jgi:hypothetical protein